MEPLLTSALVGAAATTASSAFNAISSGNLNRKNRRWQEQMFDKQNQEWQRRQEYMNEYNSAAAQKQRLIEAGLNPGLMYQGGAGGSSAQAVGSPTGTPMPATTAPALDSAAIGQAMARIPQAQLETAQANYYDAMANNENGVNRVLRQAQSSMFDALSSLHDQEKNNLSITNDILKLQRSLANLDVKAAEQDWDYGQRLIEFKGPDGQSEIIPARMMPLYMDYAGLVLGMLDARKGTTLFDAQIQNIRDQFRLIELSLPEALANSMVSSLRIGLLKSNSKEFTVTTNGKTEKISYSELLRRTMGAEVAESFDGLVSILNRVSRKNGWEKTFDVVDRVLTGSSAAAAAYNGYRGTRRPTSGRSLSRPAHFDSRGTATEYDVPLYY